MRRLVDSTIPFTIVYALYHHEYLGYLISSHIVQLLPDKQLSLVHQGVRTSNMNQFMAELDEKDQELIKLMEEISLKVIIKKFGGDPRKPDEFFLSKFQGEVVSLVENYIQRRLSKILPQLIDRKVYEMGKDGYPAHTAVSVLAEKATVLFHFRRNDDSTHYFPTIKLRGEKIEFQRKSVLICKEPAWLLLNHELFTFEQAVEGKKLLPFLRKKFIAIPREKEEEYYRKFVTQIVERYHVYAKGFQITTIRALPRFTIILKQHNESFDLIREVAYDRFSFPLYKNGSVKAIMEKENTAYTFFRIERKSQVERKIEQALDDIAPQKGTLSPWSAIPKNDGLDWLSENAEYLRELGVEISQQASTTQYHLVKPELEIVTQDVGDWFDIQAKVIIGGFEIPFVKFRTHILRNKREYILPDKSIAILPESWFSDFRHLLEVMESGNDENIRIPRYQAPILHMAQQGSGKLATYLNDLKETDSIPEVVPPTKLKAKLRNYQMEGFNWLSFMKEHDMGAILADDMGLGKTLQTLTLLQKEKENGAENPSLIILPTSLIHNWLSESQKFTPNMDIYVYAGVNRIKDVKQFPAYDLILTTYGIARQDCDILKDFPFHYIILDESQMIKNPESKTAKAIKKLVSRHRLSLTGTPIENTVMDIWSQMSFLNPGLLGSEAFFKRFYVTPIEKDFDEKRSERLRKIIYPFILRRKKQQVEKDLPPKVEKLHYCEMHEVQSELYEEIRSTYRNYLMELIHSGTWKKNKLNILTGLQKLRQIAIHPQLINTEIALHESGKYQEVKRLLQEILGKDSKVLIFSQFVKMLHILKKDLDYEGVKYAYLDGSTRDRKQQVEQFQQDKSIKVFLISLKAGGVGLNLTAADYVFLLDPWWNPAVEKQAIDRSHRIGQKNTVFYYKFITKDSIEEKILKLQQKKSRLSDDIITVEDDMYKSLNADDLGDLLQ
ncbi:MAG: DEAD/DEAH box helicase [Bacteroidota bacterium]